MTKKFINLLAGMAVIVVAATLFAQEGPKRPTAGEGTLMLQDKNYSLTHVLAYETTVNGEEAIAVVLSGQAISSEKFREGGAAQVLEHCCWRHVHREARRGQGDGGPKTPGRPGEWQSQSAERHRGDVSHGL